MIKAEFEIPSKYIGGGKIPTKLIITSRDINLPLGCCDLKGKVTFNK